MVYLGLFGKLFLATATVLSLVTCQGISRKKQNRTVNRMPYLKSGGFDYCSLNEKCDGGSVHTMCEFPDETPGPACQDTVYDTEFFSPGEQIDILRLHNELRASLSNGSMRYQPQAVNLKPLVWDTELEAIARRWAVQCVYEHDTCRLTRDGDTVGQNLATSGFLDENSQSDYSNQIKRWMRASLGFPTKYIDKYSKVPETEEYTQMVWASTERLGCEHVFFDGRDGDEVSEDDVVLRENLVCLYSPEGNVPGEAIYRSRGVLLLPEHLPITAITALVILQSGQLLITK